MNSLKKKLNASMNEKSFSDVISQYNTGMHCKYKTRIGFIKYPFSNRPSPLHQVSPCRYKQLLKFFIAIVLFVISRRSL